MLSMESTSNRMSRLGKSLITDTELMTFERDHRGDRRGRRRTSSPSSRRCCCRRSGSSASGVGPDEDKFRAAVGRATPALVATRRRMKIAFFGAEGRSARRVVPRARARRPRGARDRDRRRSPTRAARRRGRLHDAGCGAGERARRARAGRLVRRRHDGLGSGRARRARRGAGLRLFVAPNFSHRRGADDALRRARRRSTSRARRSSSCTTRRRRTRRRAPRKRDGGADRRRPGRSIRCGCPGSSRTRK